MTPATMIISWEKGKGDHIPPTKLQARPCCRPQDSGHCGHCGWQESHPRGRRAPRLLLCPPREPTLEWEYGERAGENRVPTSMGPLLWTSPSPTGRRKCSSSETITDHHELAPEEPQSRCGVLQEHKGRGRWLCVITINVGPSWPGVPNRVFPEGGHPPKSGKILGKDKGHGP